MRLIDVSINECSIKLKMAKWTVYKNENENEIFSALNRGRQHENLLVCVCEFHSNCIGVKLFNEKTLARSVCMAQRARIECMCVWRKSEGGKEACRVKRNIHREVLQIAMVDKSAIRTRKWWKRQCNGHIGQKRSRSIEPTYFTLVLLVSSSHWYTDFAKN